MRRLLAILSTALLLSKLTAAALQPALPVWDDAARTELEAAGWMAGELLVWDDSPTEHAATVAELPLDIPQPTAGEIAESEEAPEKIPEKYWAEYFAERPKSFLVDPQGLLGPVDFRDRLGFLGYHSSDSVIDLYVYVFKGEQDIPGELREEELMERFFSEGRPAVVIYYYMGAPQRSVLNLSPSLTDAVTPAEQRRSLENSVMQALKDAEPAGQIASFLVQMSIRIYWMESMLGGGDSNGEQISAVVRAAKPPEKRSTTMEKFQPVFDLAKPFLIPVSVIFGLVIAAIGLCFWIRQHARYRFPDIEVEPRLGGAHAAGVGAVISFASAALPPASQRDQVPDYLRRA